MDSSPEPRLVPTSRAAERRRRRRAGHRRLAVAVSLLVVLILAIGLAVGLGGRGGGADTGAGGGGSTTASGVSGGQSTTSSTTGGAAGRGTSSSSTSATAGSAQALVYQAQLSGASESPAVTTAATGTLTFTVAADRSNVSYVLSVKSLEDLTVARLHQGKAGQVGSSIATLYPGPAKSGAFTGLLKTGSLTASAFTGPLAGKTMSDLVTLLNAGSVYVNIGTSAHRSGELRGSSGGRRPRCRAAGSRPPARRAGRRAGRRLPPRAGPRLPPSTRSAPGGDARIC